MATPTASSATPQKTSPDQAAEAARGALSGWRRVREWRPTAAQLRRLAFVSLAANIAIVATGGLVRLSNSGLGCPTWPACDRGSLVPTQKVSWYKAVEFGNRALSVVLFVAVVVVFIAVRRATSRGTPIRRWAWVTLLGVPAQAVMGGIVTLTKLNPWVVALHFLLSMALIAAATVLWWCTRQPDVPGDPMPLLRRLGLGMWTLTYIVFSIGTVVTGSGPHAGDAKAHRIHVRPGAVAQLHADLVMLLVGVAVALAVAVTAVGGSRIARTTTRLFVAALAFQAAVGFAQYFNHLPIGLVELHLVGAALLAATSTAVVLCLREA